MYKLKIAFFIFLLGLIISPYFSLTYAFDESSLNPILKYGSQGEWDQKDVSAVDIISAKNGYEMWYYGTSQDLQGSIGFAKSTDGINWIKESSNPVLTKDQNDLSEVEISSPTVIYLNNEYKMWYLSTTTGPVGTEVFRIKHATSVDGKNWSPKGYVLRRSFSWDSEGLVPHSLLFLNNEYKIWYGARDSAGIWRIGFANSSDGINWTKNQNPVLIGSLPWEGASVAASSVTYDGQNYHMYYHAGSPPKYIGHAISSDGINWTKDQNPILTIGGFANFDNVLIAAPRSIRKLNKILLYYSGYNGTHWQIGLAEETVPVPLYLQTSSPWGTLEYDNASAWAKPASRTISSLGCALTSATMVLRYFDVNTTPGNSAINLPPKSLDPGTLNEWMKSKNDAYFRNGAVNWALIAAMTRQNHDLDPRNPKLEYFTANTNQLDSLLTQQYPGILNLDYPPSPSNSHFVVATAKEDPTYAINDPFYTNRKTLSPYYNNINKVGYYQPTNSDFSYVIAAVNPEATLHLKNDHGDIIATSFLENAPADDVLEASSGGQPLSVLYAKAPGDGNYSLELSAPETMKYQLDSYIYDVSGNGGKSTFDGLVSLDSIKTIQLNLDAENASNSSNLQITTLNDLISDINSSYNLQWFKTEKVYKNLLTRTQRALTTYTKNKLEKTKHVLVKLQMALERKHTKNKITDDAFELLTNDVQNILNNSLHITFSERTMEQFTVDEDFDE